MRVLFVLDGLWVGGTERSVAELCHALLGLDVDCHVACLVRRGAEGVENEVPADRLHFLEESRLLSRLGSYRRLVRALEPDLVHSALYRANLIVRMASRGLPTRVVNSLVNTPYEPIRFEDPAVTAWRLRAAWALDRVTAHWGVDCFHAVSKAVAESSVGRLGIRRERMRVVPRGRDPRRLRRIPPECCEDLRARLATGSNARVIINVGRQDYQKGQDVLLRTFAELARSEGAAPFLWLVGREGNASARLRRLASDLQIGERVRFLGHRADVPDLLSAADVFAFPSRFEGFPGAVVEAMALGLPVVASDIPPHRELIEPERSGLLVEGWNVDAWSSSLRRALDTSEGSAWGRRGREIFIERLTIDHCARAMRDLYERVLDARR